MRAVPYFFRLATALTFAAAAAAVALVPASRGKHRGSPGLAVACNAPADLVRLVNPLKRVAQRIAGGQPLTIVAIGSSSTAGAGASSPAMSYPSRLEVELKALFPRADITVVNRGVNGEESRDMLARFDRDVISRNPDLVLWQVGSNSVLRDRPLEEANASLREGLKRLREAGTDVVLINPQYAPKVITKHDVDGMVDLIHLTAKETNVDLFERFAVMRYWRLTEDIPFSTFISPDELHMNDWSYGCIAKLLAGAIHEAAARSTVTATARAPTARASHRFQRRQHVLDQIVGVLEPARQPHHAVADAEVGALLRLEPLVRRRRRMGDQALGVAEIVGDAHELERVLERKRALLAAGHLERHERRAAAHLLGDDRGLRMVRPAGIDQPRHLRMLGKLGRHLARGVGLRAHAHRQRLQSLEHDPGVERRHRRAGLPDDRCGCCR